MDEIKDRTEFTEKILEYQKLRLKLAEMESLLRAYVLNFFREKTTIGRIKVNYKKGARYKDYAGTWAKLHPGVEPDRKFLKIPAPAYDYNAALAAENTPEEAFLIKSETPPSVDFELGEEK